MADLQLENLIATIEFARNRAAETGRVLTAMILDMAILNERVSNGLDVASYLVKPNQKIGDIRAEE